MSLAVVTGASSGIGEATARRLDRDGWRLVLVARRADRLEAIAATLRDAQPLSLDLTADDAPARVRARVAEDGQDLRLLVNNAGAAWRGSFAEGGYTVVHRTMELNFDAVVRLTEALLPLLRRAAPSAIVNVSSTAGRIARPASAAYCASKFALAGWTEALHHEERGNGVHVGNVLPGFIATEGFPQHALRGSPRTRWMVSTPESVADAIVDAGPGGKPERYVPRVYGLLPALRGIAPRLMSRAVGRSGI